MPFIALGQKIVKMVPPSQLLLLVRAEDSKATYQAVVVPCMYVCAL